MTAPRPTIDFRDIDRLKSWISDDYAPWSDAFTVTQALIDTFAALSGDDYWIHTDPVRAERESPYGKTVAHGMLVQSLVCAVVGFAIMVVVFPWFVVELAAALAAGSLPWIRIIFLRARRMKAFDDALAQGIDMMARALRAGHSVSGAIELIAQGCPEPAASEFAEVFRQQNFGMPLRDAFMQMLDRVPSQDLRVVVTAILVQRETGGNLVEILDRTVGVIRDRQRIHGEIRTQTAQGRLTGWILTLLPVVMLALINVTNPGYSKPLFTTELGREMLYAGLVFIALGAFWIRKIINKIEV